MMTAITKTQDRLLQVILAPQITEKVTSDKLGNLLLKNKVSSNCHQDTKQASE